MKICPIFRPRFETVYRSPFKVEKRCTVVDERLIYVIPQEIFECTAGTGDMVIGDAITGAEGTKLPKIL